MYVLGSVIFIYCIYTKSLHFSHKARYYTLVSYRIGVTVYTSVKLYPLKTSCASKGRIRTGEASTYIHDSTFSHTVNHKNS